MCTLPEKQFLSRKFRCRLHWLKSVVVIIIDQNCPRFADVDTQHFTQFWSLGLCLVFFICVLFGSSMVHFCLFFFNPKYPFLAVDIESLCLESWANELQAIQSLGQWKLLVYNFCSITVCFILSGFGPYPGKGMPTILHEGLSYPICGLGTYDRTNCGSFLKI